MTELEISTTNCMDTIGSGRDRVNGAWGGVTSRDSREICEGINERWLVLWTSSFARST